MVEVSLTLKVIKQVSLKGHKIQTITGVTSLRTALNQGIQINGEHRKRHQKQHPSLTGPHWQVRISELSVNKSLATLVLTSYIFMPYLKKALKGSATYFMHPF